MSENGSVTVNVLAITALASALMLVMMDRESASLGRAGLYADGARADAVLAGAELSAVAALTRDLETAPDLDHRGEAWARIEEREAPIDGGTFSLTIEDAQGRFNLNRLTDGALSDRQVFARLSRSAGLDDTARDAVIAYMAVVGEIGHVSDLTAAGLSERELVRLTPLAVALPGKTGVSLNVAPEPVLAALFNNDSDARLLAAERDRGSPITPERLSVLRLTKPPGAVFASRWFVVESRVRIGRIELQRETRLFKDRDAGGVRIVSRRPVRLDHGA